MVKASKVKVRNTVATITANRMASPHWPSSPRLRCSLGMGPTYLNSSLNASSGTFTQGRKVMSTWSLNSRWP